MKYLATISAVIYSGRWVKLEYPEMPLYSNIASTALFLALLCTLLFLGSHYLKLILSLKKAKTIWPYFTLLAMWVLSVGTFYNFGLILNDQILLLSFLAFIFSFTFSGISIMDTIVERFPVKGDIKFLTSKNPPAERSDLLRGDIAMIFVSLIPIISRMIH